MEIILIILTAVSSVISVCAIVLLLRLVRRGSIHGGRELEQAIRNEFHMFRDESGRAAKDLREEVAGGQRTSTDIMVNAISKIGKSQTEHLELVAKRIKELTESNESRIERIRDTIDTQLRHLKDSNEKKLDEMRQTVDERLQSTLEKRLGESFKMVSKHLEAVQRGLGEMQSLATGVGDLKRVLTNVKARGVWGEVQLGALLEQILTVDQYAKNVYTREGSQEFVEYAVRLPGTDDDPGSCVWLPIDSKFPQEDYLRLADAADTCDAEAVQRATAGFIRAVHASARDISEKYLDPPRTTDFAIMFLPTEGLYAEVLRQPGQIEEIQQKYRIVIAGPTTLSAILNSLRMGFQTLALEKRSNEVWAVLGAVKTEFGKFGSILAKVKKQLNAASNTIDQTEVRTRAMARKLRQVEQLPSASSSRILEIEDTEQTNIETGEEE
jgi:DNA recombination protein RmuC